MSYELLVKSVKENYSIEPAHGDKWQMRFLNLVYLCNQKSKKKAMQECSEKVADKIRSLYQELNPLFEELEK